MTTSLTQPTEQYRVKRAAALCGLRDSLLINVLGPYLLYRMLVPRFQASSVWPLALSGLIPLLNLAYGLLRTQSLDVLALFAAEDVLVSLVATLLARTPIELLVGRSSQNAILALIFVGSLVIRKPLMLLVARQFSTGSEPSSLTRFDELARRDDVLKVYRFMTGIWATVLFAKTLASIAMALSLSTDHYLVLSSLVTYGSDALLILWSFRYANARIGYHYAISRGPDEAHAH